MFRFVALLLSLCGALSAQTVLIVPFFNHSNSENLSWIGESIAETAHDLLASEDVLTLDREDRLEAYRRLTLRPRAELTHASIIKLAQALDASIAIYGDYELAPAETGGQSKGTLRIHARMMNLRSTTLSGSLVEEGPLEDLAALEVRLAWQALSLLRPKNAPPREAFLKQHPPVRLDAVESYIRGLLATTADQRRRFFMQAARLDDTYSQPCFQLGKAYWSQKDYRVASGWFQRVTQSDSHFREGLYYLALCEYHMADFQAAAKAFRDVSETMPLNEVFNNLGAALAQLKSNDQAMANYQKAIEGDSADPDYRFNLGYSQWLSGQFAQAADSFRAVLERNPSDNEATAFLGLSIKGQGPRPGDTRSEGRQRLKTNYDEAAYRQLQAELQK
jgi:tetratricopeptide (TPR) repeat protein